MNVIDGIRKYNSYHLATIAGALAPDDQNGDGAMLLDKVRDATIEAVELRAKEQELTLAEAAEEYRERIQDSVADKAPDSDQEVMWRQFVELGGYRELDQLRKDGTPNNNTLEGWAELALFTIAFRLVSVLLTEIQEG
ncbi:OCR-like antirestriction protein [Streptomyces phage BartholomewSD]|uniref:OCR-like antirestriction protein n=1 Tax=Streptomyces phage Alvy TaxID=2599888 RepID=A0A5J6TUZ4_9CAUD|nr:hypothetical protein KGG89_gp20 [Streptomyces phage Alvy]QAX95523.1 OCR-like antirestriction protein [Streptomyces phage BartholomewSD]QFG12482.1 OCR-like antirestriction protein [Streptomyces phage Alvy]